LDGKLVQIQLDSYKRFVEYGVKELLDEIFPIEDDINPRYRMVYGNQETDPSEDDESEFELQEPPHSEAECVEKGMTHASPLYVRVRLINKERKGEEEEQKIYFGDIPKMTPRGTFIVNGSERVVVSQIVRSPGAYFHAETDRYTGVTLCQLKIIPDRGVWIEAETAADGAIYIKIDRRRKLVFTTLLRSFGMKKEEIDAAFRKKGLTKRDLRYIEATWERDTASNYREALQDVYRRIRPNEPQITDMERAKDVINRTFFNTRFYDLGRAGRMLLNRRLGNKTRADRTLTQDEIIDMIAEMTRINNGKACKDDVDHMGNRRVRTVGELLQKQLRAGLLRMERSILERMTNTYHDTDARISPAAFINNRPVVSAARNFFTGSQLSHFMDQTNPLAELTHQRRISSMGVGGLTRERASFDVRDVHYSHYGRLCPIETPEGPNIGLLSSLATFARVDENGLIRTPYRRILHSLSTKDSRLAGKTTLEDITDAKGETLVKAGEPVRNAVIEAIGKLPARQVRVKPYVSADEVEFLTGDVEERHKIAQASTRLDAQGQISSDIVEVRQGENYALAPTAEVEFIDYSSRQMVSVTTALIPFLEYDDANRALMGSNMQRQAVPLTKPQAPLVGTGMERTIARNSGRVILSDTDGIVSYSSGERIEVLDETGNTRSYDIVKFKRSNQGTCINQRPTVKTGDIIKKGEVIADSFASDDGELALGQNLLVGFMSWEGYNFEDAIVINQDLVKNDRFTSIHIERYEVSARSTPLGDEEITADISKVNESRLTDLDETGVVREGAWVEKGDILVGKVSPKGESDLTAEEKLLHAIFGDKARDVKDTSLRLPHGQRGRVIKVQELNRDNTEKLDHGVIKKIRVWIAYTRKISTGDKMAGRHGNKGVVARILPREDMPFLPDGRPLDILLNPIGVPSRMNLGQLLETHVGLAADMLNQPVRRSVFESMTQVEVEDALARAWMAEVSGAIDRSELSEFVFDERKLDDWLAERDYRKSQFWEPSFTNRGRARDACLKIWLTQNGVDVPADIQSRDLMDLTRDFEEKRGAPSPISGKTKLYDGRTGELFEQPVTVGNIYMMKLIHLSEDKIHARSTGPYSLITQQPLGGKAQFGGQRFGEMEVWALQAYSAARTLQEVLTIKSDSVSGRYRAYDAISKGDLIEPEGVPESFNVLIKELQSLCLQVDLQSQYEGDGEEIKLDGKLEASDLGSSLFDLSEMDFGDADTDAEDVVTPEEVGKELTDEKIE